MLKIKVTCPWFFPAGWLFLHERVAMNHSHEPVKQICRGMAMNQSNQIILIRTYMVDFTLLLRSPTLLGASLPRAHALLRSSTLLRAPLLRALTLLGALLLRAWTIPGAWAILGAPWNWWTWSHGFPKNIIEIVMALPFPTFLLLYRDLLPTLNYLKNIIWILHTNAWGSSRIWQTPLNNFWYNFKGMCDNPLKRAYNLQSKYSTI
jgi:hypothetical protein